MHSVCGFELYIAVNNIQIFGFCTEMLLWQIYVAGENRTCLGLNVLYLIFLCSFNQIWSVLTDFCKGSQHQIS
jgi:hypothetical protein